MSNVTPVISAVIPANAAPTIANLQGDVTTQVEGVDGESNVDVGRDAVISDSDSTDFAGGRLTVAVTSGFQSNDHIGLYQDGIVELNFNTGAVTVNGIEIGTAAGGYITSPSSPAFTIDFNANATPALVQTLLRNIYVRDPFVEPRGGARDVQVTLSDGDGGQSSYTTQLQVTAVNDEPAGADNTRTINEDQAVALTAADFGFDDNGSSPFGEGQTLQAVIVTTLPTAGTLYLDPDGADTGSLGTAVTAGQPVSAADIAAGRLVYVPAANANGIGNASFTFQVQDSGGTTDGGQDTDQSPNTLTFNVTAVNDAPVANPDSYSTDEDTPVQFSIASLRANDTDADGDTIMLTNLGPPQNGTYTANGGFVTFTPNQDFAGDATLDYTISDGNGGTSVGRATVTVAAVNDAPVADLNGASGGIDTTASYTEDTAAVKLTPGIVLSDVDSANLTGATVTIASGFVAGDIVRVANGQSGTTADGIAYSYNSATGVLTLSGSASVAAYQSALATLAFKTNNNTPSTARDITVTVTDGSATSTVAHVALTVTPVNDAPTVANLQGDTSSFNEGDGAFTTSLDLGLNAVVGDVDNANFNGGSLNIAVTGGVAAEDFIYFNNGNPAFGLTFSGNTISQGGVAFATFNAPSADRTFTFFNDGSATPARVEQLIRSLTYYNSNQTDPSPGAHTVTYTLNDGSGGISTTTATVNVVANNSAPVADLNGAGGGIDTTASYTEGASGVKLAPSIVVSDPDNATLTGATVSIASGFVAGDVLRLSGGPNGTTAEGIAYSYSAATGVLTLSGSASVAAYQAALANLSFKSNSTDPGAARDIVVTVTDGSATSTAAHIALTITEVADPAAADAFDFTALPGMAASGGDPFLALGAAPSLMAADLLGADPVAFGFGEDHAGNVAPLMFDPVAADLML